MSSSPDCAEVFKLVHLADRLQHRVYNVGGGRAFKTRELIETLKKMVPEAKIDLRPGANPLGTPKDNYLDLFRVRGEFGFTPSYPIDKGIADYITWLRSHPQ